VEQARDRLVREAPDCTCGESEYLPAFLSVCEAKQTSADSQGANDQ
jgi:hypothetical protein